MSFWEDFPRRRRFTSFWRWLLEDLERMEEEMARFSEEFEEYFEKLPKDLVKEKKIPGGVIKEYGPFVYGYSMTIGPDGKPIIREFGNVRPSTKKPYVDIKGEREPLIDVFSTNGEIRVIAEIPGVEKDQIKLNATEKKLTIRAETETRKYYKEVELPEEVDVESAKSTYKNGVLEVIFKKKKEKLEGKSIKVE
ncbi:MAG: archaeal heat shock protein Hsp20 [Nitrososphaerota archaeon]